MTDRHGITLQIVVVQNGYLVTEIDYSRRTSEIMSFETSWVAKDYLSLLDIIGDRTKDLKRPQPAMPLASVTTEPPRYKEKK